MTSSPDTAFRPARRLLLVGHPGAEKDLDGASDRRQIQLPLFAIRLDSIITKFMGETETKLVFFSTHWWRPAGSPCLTRWTPWREMVAPNDIINSPHLYNSFPTVPGRDTSDSVIVAATNHPGLLDNALFRRFNTVMDFDLPADKNIQAVVENRLASFSTSNLSWKRIIPEAQGLSHAGVYSLRRTPRSG